MKPFRLHCPVSPGNCPAKKKRVFFGDEIRVGRERYSTITPIDAESCVGSDLAGALGVGYSLAATRPKDQWVFFPAIFLGKYRTAGSIDNRDNLYLV
jgi:hypothetical protein